jgi:hypothetical protein
MANEIETRQQQPVVTDHTHTHTKTVDNHDHLHKPEADDDSLTVNTSLLISAVVLFLASAISIGVSGGQYQNDDGGVQWSPTWDTICNRWPQDMLRRKMPLCFFL